MKTLNTLIRFYCNKNIGVVKITEKFEIKDTFLLNDKEFKILSGAIHYYRVHPDDWYHSLFNLKALGFNTVETYVPWNVHEPQKGQYNFNGILDIEIFLETAKELGLYAIVRPSPYICAEWEFGGLPAWLLNYKDVKIRSSDSKFLQHVDDYFDVLLKKLSKHQLTSGGNVLMFQIENEYGSYGDDKEYLRELKKIMRSKGITAPLFTSDGSWRATMRAGSLIEDDVLVTGNFGSKGKENFSEMQKFFDEHDKDWPYMVMEFWDGWFDRWNEPVVVRNPKELAESVKEVLELGSINLYMFHGGTNFGFMNGSSARGEIDLPQVTSYDYDALLNEQGNPTKKYWAVYSMLSKHFPEYEQTKPIYKETLDEKTLEVSNKVSLFNTLESISKPIKTKYPLTMEKAGQNFGYHLYRTTIEKDSIVETFRVIDGRDRVHFYANEKLKRIQYQKEIGEDIEVRLNNNHNQIDILVENMGRVNYGHKLLADTQNKGLRGGVMADLHFITEWKQYPLTLNNIDKVDFLKEWTKNQPAFYKFEFILEDLLDTYIDMSHFGKGVVFINDTNIGRYWNVGPINTLYVPHGLLKTGKNEIVIFETEGIYSDKLKLTTNPIITEKKEG